MAEQKERRKLQITEQEIESLKGVFADNEELLKAVRKLFLGFKVTKSEADLIKSAFSDKSIVSAFRKKIYPTLDVSDDIGQLADYWFGTETEITDKSPESIRQIVESKDLTRKMLEKSFRLLENPLSSNDLFDNSVSPDFEKDPFQITLIARNKYLRTVETGLAYIKVIAGQKTESAEQAKKRLEQDSTK